ncbi:response regulator [Paenibacillus turpanensis]|uniref:response regulator n=1 Tax=Paenibacillus turpanensis TaxID=2689078 RepID=UPI001407C9CE
MASVLVVDDDPHMRELMRIFLRREGYAVREAANGVEALAEMEKAPADIVVLDIMMPDMDGWELCRELRGIYSELPLLMVTAKNEMSQKVKGFNLGTDDYLTKPFEPQELVIRVKALLRRYRIASERTVRVGAVKLDQTKRAVMAGGETFHLPLKEFDLLYQLASYPGQIFSREQLIESVWGIDHEGDERTVDVHIKRLRERFERFENDFRIVTVRGLGYRLEAREHD